MTPSFAIKARVLAALLSDAGYYPTGVHTIRSHTPAPRCVWCADDGHHHPATISLYHDCGVVHTCPTCLITAAAIAADESTDGSFFIEIGSQDGVS